MASLIITLVNYQTPNRIPFFQSCKWAGLKFRLGDRPRTFSKISTLKLKLEPFTKKDSPETDGAVAIFEVSAILRRASSRLEGS